MMNIRIAITQPWQTASPMAPSPLAPSACRISCPIIIATVMPPSESVSSRSSVACWYGLHSSCSTVAAAITHIAAATCSPNALSAKKTLMKSTANLRASTTASQYS